MPSNKNKIIKFTDDSIKIECYGKINSISKVRRKKEIANYLNAVLCSDGCEKERYISVVLGLIAEYDKCFDTMELYPSTLIEDVLKNIK